MKIDRRKIDMFCGMRDDRMWSAIKLFAGSSGIDLSKKKVTQREIANLRAMLRSLTDSDIARINELMQIYKSGR